MAPDQARRRRALWKPLQPQSRGGRAQLGRPAIPLAGLREVSLSPEVRDAETSEPCRIVSPAKSKCGLRIIAFGRPP